MPQVIIYSFNDLFNKLEGVVIKSLNEYGDEIKEKLKKEIDETVYSAGSPVKYNRTGDLKNSVIKTKAKRQGNEISVFIKHDTDLMTLDSNNFIHGSNYWSGGTDFRDSLPWAINFGESGTLFGDGWWRNARPYFTNTALYVIQNGHSDFKNVLRKNGLDIK